MSPLRRSPLPIASAAEPSLWWAEVLSEPVADGRTLSLFWPGSSDHRLGRVLTLTGVPPRPEPPVVDVVRQLRGTLVAEGSLCTRAHTAIALSRPGASSIDDDDEAWARALQAALGEDCLETWSVHVAAGGWITTVVDPPFGEVPPTPHLPAPPAELLDRSWLADHN